jgi:hypothetical protein
MLFAQRGTLVLHRHSLMKNDAKMNQLDAKYLCVPEFGGIRVRIDELGDQELSYHSHRFLIEALG